MLRRIYFRSRDLRAEPTSASRVAAADLERQLAVEVFAGSVAERPHSTAALYAPAAEARSGRPLPGPGRTRWSVARSVTALQTYGFAALRRPLGRREPSLPLRSPRISGSAISSSWPTSSATRRRGLRRMRCRACAPDRRASRQPPRHATVDPCRLGRTSWVCSSVCNGITDLRFCGVTPTPGMPGGRRRRPDDRLSELRPWKRVVERQARALRRVVLRAQVAIATREVRYERVAAVARGARDLQRGCDQAEACNTPATASTVPRARGHLRPARK